MDTKHINNNKKFYDIDRNNKKDTNYIEEPKVNIYNNLVYNGSQHRFSL